MDADEVVMHGVDRDGVLVVLNLLRKRIGKPGEPARAHPQCQVRPLRVAGADVLRVGAAFHAGLDGALAVARAVAACAGRVAIDFDKHGVVDIRAKGLLHSFKVRLVAVAAELHPVGQAQRQVGDEQLRRLGVARADVERGDQLGVGVDRHPRPGVAGIVRVCLGGGDVLGLRIDERPNLIDLHALAGQVAHHPVLIFRERRARISQQASQGVLADARGAADRPQGHAFDHEAENLSAEIAGELVYRHGYMTLHAWRQA